MNYHYKYREVLNALGWNEIQPKLWKKEKDDYGYLLMDFRSNSKGESKAYDNYDGWLPHDIVEEMDPVAIFRKKQEYILKGIPISYKDIKKVKVR